MHTVIIKINQGISGLKIGFLKEGFEGVEEDVATIVRGAALRLSGLGAIINDVTVPLHDDGMLIHLLSSMILP